MKKKIIISTLLSIVAIISFIIYLHNENNNENELNKLDDLFTESPVFNRYRPTWIRDELYFSTNSGLVILNHTSKKYDLIEDKLIGLTSSEFNDEKYILGHDNKEILVKNLNTEEIIKIQDYKESFSSNERYGYLGGSISSDKFMIISTESKLSIFNISDKSVNHFDIEKLHNIYINNNKLIGQGTNTIIIDLSSMKIENEINPFINIENDLFIGNIKCISNESIIYQVTRDYEYRYIVELDLNGDIMQYIKSDQYLRDCYYEDNKIYQVYQDGIYLSNIESNSIEKVVDMNDIRYIIVNNNTMLTYNFKSITLFNFNNNEFEDIFELKRREII